MEYRTLGGTGVKVSALSLGTVMFGPVGNDDVDECVRMTHEALDAGVNLIDTADTYSNGVSEEIVGKAIAGRRDEVLVATKCHNPMGDGVNDRGNTRLWITRAVEGSLRRLGVDHIDLYQLHRHDPDVALEETLGVLTDLVHQGKVRYIGTSTFPAWILVESQWVSERRPLERFVCEQPPYSIFARHPELDVLPVAQEHGMGCIVWGPLAGGWLAGKYRRGQEMDPESRAARNELVYYRARLDQSIPANQLKLDLVERLIEVADKAGISLAHLALGFVLAHPGVTSAIVGPRTPEQLRQLLDGSDVRLDSATLDAIDEIVAPGTVLNPADKGWEGPWMAPQARRR
jgi:aryl-alcohol dehydrogenase-like predicted oxidoreductase